ncbi:MAG: iron-sulfur cluster assembly protein [Acidimicrobiales bacterium]
MSASTDAGPITLARDCPATTVPDGEVTVLRSGAVVHLVQRMGGSITVRSDRGTLLRVDRDDSDALGLVVAPPERHVSLVRRGPFEMQHVTDALHTVYDPEIPVSIVDLGLVYRCEEVVDADGRRCILIDMTMTSPGCGMGDVLRDDAIQAVERLHGVDSVEVHLVFDPPWGLERISEDAKLELGLL